MSQEDPPKISSFGTSKTVIGNREAFVLSWDVQDATSLEIYRNGILFKESDPGETSINLQENYDGKDKTIEFQLIAINSLAKTESETIEVRLAGNAKNALPKIVSFLCDKSVVTKRETFTLRWNVENATEINILRNSIVFRRLTDIAGSLPISENYDGVEKTITFELNAYNGKEKTESKQLTITVTDNAAPISIKPVKPEPPKPVKPADTTIAPEYQAEKKSTLKNIRLYLGALAAVLVIAAGILIFLSLSKPKISSFNPASVVEGHSVLITGKNFPNDPSKIQVLFNNIPGKVEHSSSELLRVVVPLLDDKLGDGNVIVRLVEGTDTFTSNKPLIVQKRPLAEEVSEQQAPVVSDTIEAVPEAVEQPKKRPSRKPRVTEDESGTAGVTPDPVKTETPKDKIDISGQVKLIVGDFKKRMLGGVKGLQLTVQNDSPFDVDNVTVEIIYTKKNDREVKKELFSIAGVRAHTSLTKEVPNSNRGADVRARISSIFSKQLNDENQGRN